MSGLMTNAHLASSKGSTIQAVWGRAGRGEARAGRGGQDVAGRIWAGRGETVRGGSLLVGFGAPVWVIGRGSLSWVTFLGPFPLVIGYCSSIHPHLSFLEVNGKGVIPSVVTV